MVTMTLEEHEDLTDALTIEKAMREIESSRVKTLSVDEVLADFEIVDENSPAHWPDLQHFC